VQGDACEVGCGGAGAVCAVSLRGRADNSTHGKGNQGITALGCQSASDVLYLIRHLIHQVSMDSVNAPQVRALNGGRSAARAVTETRATWLDAGRRARSACSRLFEIRMGLGC